MFSSMWYKEYPHLENSVKADYASCFFVCPFSKWTRKEESVRCLGNCVRSWDRMRSVGKDKKGKLQQHFSSDSHKAALNDLAHFACDMKNVDVLLDKKLREVRIHEEEKQAKKPRSNKDLTGYRYNIGQTTAGF